MISLHLHATPAADLILRRLQSWSSLSLAEEFGNPLSESPIERVDAGRIILQCGPAAMESRVLVSGVAAEQRVLEDGRRQIIALRLPGDVLTATPLEPVCALSDVEVVDAAPVLQLLTDGAEQRPRLRRAWIAAARAEQGMQRDQIVRLGRLSALERFAHVLSELHERLLQVGLASVTAFHLPIRQDMMADLLGLSVVHLSRVTQQLRAEHLVEIRSSYVSLLDRERLADLGCYVRRTPATPLARRERMLDTILSPRLAAHS